MVFLFYFIGDTSFQDEVEDWGKELIGGDDDDDEKEEEDFEDDKEVIEEIEEEEKKEEEWNRNIWQKIKNKHSQDKIKKMEWPKDLDIFEIVNKVKLKI